MNRQFDPLSYNIPPPSPLPSFARNLQLSAYLFPSRRLPCSSAISDEVTPPTEKICCDVTAEIDNDLLITRDFLITPPSDQCNITMITNNTKPKKKVTFLEDVDAVTPEHTPTDNEKRLMWYSQDEYDGFKFHAARDAGVRLFDYVPPSKKTSREEGSNATTVYPHKFVMIGNFDEQDEETSSVATAAAFDQGIQPASNHDMKDTASHHVPTKCMNEYNDTVSIDGDHICKRGLGHHFSRSRKRNRVWTRAMVLTWQKTIRSMTHENGSQLQPCSSGEESLNLSQKCDVKLDGTSQRLLAAVSAKCSRSARLAALWRGKMDQEVVCRESSGLRSHESARICESNNKKRSVDRGDEHQRSKRLRCDVRNDTTAFSYLAGVLSVEI